MKFVYKFISTLIFASLGFTQAYAVCVEQSLTIHNIERTEVVCTPIIASVSMPVLLVFHGRGGSGANIAEGVRFHEAWPEALVVYLDGLPGIPAPYDKEGRYPGWQLNPGEANDRDVEFVDATLINLEKQFKIDKQKIFATGHSNGSRFLGVLLAMRSQRFAGFAFSASQAGNLIKLSVPKPLFMGMGIHDELIPFEDQKQSIKLACNLLGLSLTQFEHEGANRSVNKDGIELMTFIHPGGHRWPEEQTKMIVDFFKRQL
jgi:polyhydroxybutyrate depolymerase